MKNDIEINIEKIHENIKEIKELQLYLKNFLSLLNKEIELLEMKLNSLSEKTTICEHSGIKFNDEGKLINII